jgi:hypothetical protein
MTLAWNMWRRGITPLVIAVSLAASAVHAADALDLARRLVGYTGGVNLILLNFEGGMAASVAAPAIFKQSFDQAIADNQAALTRANEDLAKVYAKLYPVDLMAAEISFYESPEAQAIMTKSRDTFGVVVWPDPGSMGLSAEQSAALTKFHDTVKRRAAIAAQDSNATDAMMTAETGALVKIRSAAFANYCKIRDCKAEGVTPPPQ